jgi:hypothetical protein
LGIGDLNGGVQNTWLGLAHYETLLRGETGMPIPERPAGILARGADNPKPAAELVHDPVARNRLVDHDSLQKPSTIHRLLF